MSSPSKASSTYGVGGCLSKQNQNQTPSWYPNMGCAFTRYKWMGKLNTCTQKKRTGVGGGWNGLCGPDLSEIIRQMGINDSLLNLNGTSTQKALQ